jgi:hypothetical protein
MGKQNTNLKSSLQQSAGDFQKPELSVVKDTVPETHQQRSPSRRGKKSFTLYIDSDVLDQLTLLTIETRKSKQDLGIDALNLLLKFHNKPPIA